MHKKKILRLVLIIILVIALGVIILCAYRVGMTQWAYKLNPSAECVANAGSSKDTFAVVATIQKDSDGKEKRWTMTDKSIGTVYDLEIYNNTTNTYKDWYIVIADLPAGSYVESCWDCECTVVTEGDYAVLTTETLDYNKELFGSAKRSLGFVLYTPTAYDISIVYVYGTNVSASATPNLISLINDMSDNTAMIVLFISAGFWLVALGIFLYDLFSDKAYRRQRNHDKEMIVQAISTFTNFIDAKDPYTKGHSSRVALYSREIARRMKMSEDQIENIYYIGLLHDAGKIGIPDGVLNKPGKLDEEEFAKIKEHTTNGEKILQDFTAIEGIQNGAKYHHERYDGKGYPEGLKGEDIPLCARIICVADSYDAMSSNRCYRKHLDKEVILSELKNNSGTQFDPSIVVYMIDMIEDGFTDKIQHDDPSGLTS